MADWCTTAAVNERLENIAGKGYNDPDVQNRISRAQNELKSKLMGAYAPDTVDGWDTTTPGVIKDMCADLAAIKIKTDFIDDYKLSDTEKALLKWIKDIVDGKAELMDDSGTRIARSTPRIKFSRGTAKTPIFSTGNVGDDTYGQGTLDKYGPDQEAHEGDLE